jgi:hypothetical protein
MIEAESVATLANNAATLKRTPCTVGEPDRFIAQGTYDTIDDCNRNTRTIDSLNTTGIAAYRAIQKLCSTIAKAFNSSTHVS